MASRENIFVKEKVHFNLIRLHKDGKNFEAVVEPDLAIEYKKNRKNSREELTTLLRAEKIFHDAKRGLFASEDELEAAFGTSDVLDVAQRLISEGEIQLTSEYREKMRDEKRKRIVQLIHRSAIDPKTNLPHPISRIENAINEAKVRIDEMRKAEDQVNDIVTKLKPIIPIKIDNRTLNIKLPLQYAAKLHSSLPTYGKIESEQWQSDGSYSCRLTVPAGMQAELFDDLSKKTHGAVQISVEQAK